MVLEPLNYQNDRTKPAKNILPSVPPPLSFRA